MFQRYNGWCWANFCSLAACLPRQKLQWLAKTKVCSYPCPVPPVVPTILQNRIPILENRIPILPRFRMASRWYGRVTCFVIDDLCRINQVEAMFACTAATTTSVAASEKTIRQQLFLTGMTQRRFGFIKYCCSVNTCNTSYSFREQGPAEGCCGQKGVSNLGIRIILELFDGMLFHRTVDVRRTTRLNWSCFVRLYNHSRASETRHESSTYVTRIAQQLFAHIKFTSGVLIVILVYTAVKILACST